MRRSRMGDRRSIPRAQLKVIHLHRLGRRRFRRLSELVFVPNSRPRAVLEWVDPEKLRRAKRLRNTYCYDGETVDPRYLDAAVFAYILSD